MSRLVLTAVGGPLDDTVSLDVGPNRLERVYSELAELVTHGALSAVEAAYPLDQYQQARRHAQQNGRTGKVVFVPNGQPVRIGTPATALSCTGAQ